MKKTLLFPLIMLLIVQLACGISAPDVQEGSGNIVTIEENFTDFTALDINHAFDVTVMQGDEYSVTIRVDDNFVDDLDIKVQGDALKIGFKSTFNTRMKDATFEADITMPELSAIDVSSASRVKITGFSSSAPFLANVSSAGSLRGAIDAGDTTLDVSSASSVELDGSGADLVVNASGASTVDLSDFPVGGATVDASSASRVTVNVSGTLDVDASSASNVMYLGNPTLGAIDLSGASSVEEK
jgi:hypothetical protein